MGNKDLIPKILHQTVKNKDNIPANWKAYQKSWLKFHSEPEWRYCLWDDNDNDKFVRTEYPQYYQLYLELPYPINRVDLVRYLYLHKFGGWYSDMDTECLKPIDPLCNLPGKTIIMGERPFFGHQNVECAFMGSAPGDPFWLLVIHGIHQSFYAPAMSKRLVSIIPTVNVLMTTGPLLLDSILKSCPKSFYERIQVFPQSYFFPDPNTPRHELPSEAYALHWSDTSWVSGAEYVLGRMHRYNSGQVVLIVLIALAFMLVLGFIYFAISAAVSGMRNVFTTENPKALRLAHARV